MSPLGTLLTVLVGPTVPVPAPPVFMENLVQVEVSASGRGRSLFRLTFAAGRSGPADLVDYPLLSVPVLRPFARVVLVVTLSGVPAVLLDGVITHRELTPGAEPGSARLTVIGEDVSLMLDLEEKSAEHPAQDEAIIATKLIFSYPQYGLLPMVIPPPLIDPPIPIERTPVQQATDYGYLTRLADRFGYIFKLEPGPVPLVNTAYWGPSPRIGPPQRALAVDLGTDTNVDQITFRHDALAPVQVAGTIQDRLTGAQLQVRSAGVLRPPLAAMPDWQVNQPNVRTERYRDSGVSISQALARAQGAADAASDTLAATGTLDVLRYGGLLAPGRLVGLRGAGWQHSGLYYVHQVDHTIKRGSYTQSFTLTREGVGSTVPVVIP